MMIVTMEWDLSSWFKWYVGQQSKNYVNTRRWSICAVSLFDVIRHFDPIVSADSQCLSYFKLFSIEYTWDRGIQECTM